MAMISSLKIEGYRGFNEFQMSGLGRINLLVGTNNSGKTSVLEAVHLLMSAGDPLALLQLLGRRGERFIQTIASIGKGVLTSENEWDISHIFRGHDPIPGSAIRVSAHSDSGPRFIQYMMVDGTPVTLMDPENDGAGPLDLLEVTVSGRPTPVLDRIPLTSARSFSINQLTGRVGKHPADAPRVQFVSTESLSGARLARLWGDVMLTDSEDLVLRALRFFDPDVERIAVLGSDTSSNGSRGGFLLRLRGVKRPVPIGSMGDGMWRMLALALALVRCEGGVLLVDEIDTGLHYSVMSKMWTLVYNAAKELGVQVFATTHSYDCVYSLAAICTDEDRGAVTVQRIEKGKTRSVPYDEDEIAADADHNIEVR